MNFLSYRTAGWFTIVAGILSLIGMLLLFGFFGGSGLMGILNDVTGVLGDLLIIPLFLVLGTITMSRNARLGLAVQIAAVLGLLLKITGGVLILSGVPFESAEVWLNAGSIPLGVAIMTVAIANWRNPLLSRGYLIFSLIAGFPAALRVIAFIVPAVTDQLLEAMMGSGELNPLLYPLIVVSIVSIIAPPIWELWSGRLLLRAAAQEDEALQPHLG